MLRFYNFQAVRFWLIRVLAFCIMKLGGCLPYGSSWNRLSKLDLRFWRSFFQVLRHLERHFHFLSSIYRQENNYSVALLFRNWFLFRPWCLGTLYTSSLRRSFFTAELFALGQVSPSRINPRGYNLVKPRKWVMAIALTNFTEAVCFYARVCCGEGSK